MSWTEQQIELTGPAAKQGLTVWKPRRKLPSKFVLSMGLLAMLQLMVPAVAKADVIYNGAFATGDLTGWTTTPGGNATVVADNPTGSAATYAAEFQTGNSGDGIYQDVDAPEAGTYNFSASFAAQILSGDPNLEGGAFAVIIDGTTEASVASNK